MVYGYPRWPGVGIANIGFGTSNVTPATYDESLTYYEQLAHLRDHMQTVIDTAGESDSKLKQVVDDFTATIDALTEKLALDLELYKDSVEFMIESSHDSMVSFNPTDGTRHKPVDINLNNVFDNLRIYSYFARQYDDLGMTAAEYDALNWTARHYDVAPLTVINDEWPMHPANTVVGEV